MYFSNTLPESMHQLSRFEGKEKRSVANAQFESS